MARLTQSQVRARMMMVVILTVATPILVLLAMMAVGSNEWFWLLLFLIDIPAAVVLGIIEWADRTAA